MIRFGHIQSQYALQHGMNRHHYYYMEVPPFKLRGYLLQAFETHHARAYVYESQA